MNTNTASSAPAETTAPNPVDLYRDQLVRILEANGLKKRSSKAGVIEYGFLQGIRAALGDATPAYLLVCLSCGRSILD